MSQACARAVGAGFAEVAQSPDDAGVSSFWVAGRRWVLCDVATASASSEPTVISPTPSSRARGFDERSFSLTATPLSSPQGRSAGVRFVAGGRLPWAVKEIGFRFPDGHTEQARFVGSERGHDTWWSMTYTVTDGPLDDGGQGDLGPVTVSVAGSVAEAFRLPWGDVQRTE